MEETQGQQAIYKLLRFIIYFLVLVEFFVFVITPDGKCYNPQGSDVSAYMEGIENPYAYFYNEAATYTP